MEQLKKKKSIFFRSRCKTLNICYLRFLETMSSYCTPSLDFRVNTFNLIFMLFILFLSKKLACYKRYYLN